MKTRYGTIMVLAMVTVVLSATLLPCWAGEKEEVNIWVDDETGRMQQRISLKYDLTDEKIEQTMNRLAETDVEKAKELARLQEEDPEKFKAELQKIIREHIHKMFRERGEEGFCPPGMPKMPGMPGLRGMPGMPVMPVVPGKQPDWSHMRRHAQLMDWLEENYPEKAKELAELREEKPELYWTKWGLSLKKYGRIAEAAEENPKLAEVLKEDLELRQQRDELLKEIETAGGDEKEELVAELENVISKRFDFIVQRKQIEYEQLLQKLEQLKEKVKQSEAEAEKWKDAEFKDENIKARVGELLGQPVKFDWD